MTDEPHQFGKIFSPDFEVVLEPGHDYFDTNDGFGAVREILPCQEVFRRKYMQIIIRNEFLDNLPE